MAPTLRHAEIGLHGYKGLAVDYIAPPTQRWYVTMAQPDQRLRYRRTVYAAWAPTGTPRDCT
jgi:hypothetical protein